MRDSGSFFFGFLLIPSARANFLESKTGDEGRYCWQRTQISWILQEPFSASYSCGCALGGDGLEINALLLKDETEDNPLPSHATPILLEWQKAPILSV